MFWVMLVSWIAAIAFITIGMIGVWNAREWRSFGERMLAQRNAAVAERDRTYNDYLSWRRRTSELMDRLDRAGLLDEGERQARGSGEDASYDGE